MARHFVRELKRRVASSARTAEGSETAYALGREAALALLERSITFGHGRLAVIRMSIAVQAGADVSIAQWKYCENAVERAADSELRAIFINASRQLLTRISVDANPTPAGAVNVR